VLIDDLLRPKVLIVSGKGGVGKTTVSAALALVAARRGRRVCVAEVDQKGTLSSLLGGGELTYEPTELLPGIWAMNIDPEHALAEYLDVQYHMKRISRIFTSSHFVDYITTAAPGLEDILVLGKIWYLETGRSQGARPGFDTIIVDAPAAGHMLTFLSAPMGLSDAVRVGPIKRQADRLIEMLQDQRRTRVHLVTLPEEMPVAETLETAAAVENRIGLNSGAVIANGVYPRLLTGAQLAALDEDGGMQALSEAGTAAGLKLDAEDFDALRGYALFLSARRKIQGKHLRALKQRLDDPVIELPFLFTSGLALPDVETLADVLEHAVEEL
jgi:anion-transporting  ArsA/GET3 family ATPase